MHNFRWAVLSVVAITGSLLGACPGRAPSGIVPDAGKNDADAGANTPDAGTADAGVPTAAIVVTVEKTQAVTGPVTNLIVELDIEGCPCAESVWRLEDCTLKDRSQPCGCAQDVCAPMFSLDNGVGVLSPDVDILDLLPATYFHSVPPDFDPTLSDSIRLAIDGCGDPVTVALGHRALPAVTLDATTVDGGVLTQWSSDVEIDSINTAAVQADTATYCPESVAQPATAGSLTLPWSEVLFVNFGRTSETPGGRVFIVSSTSAQVSPQ